MEATGADPHHRSPEFIPGVKEIVHGSLSKLILVTFKEMMATVGVSATLQAVKSPMKQSGMAFSRNLNARFGVDEKGVEGIAFPLAAANHYPIGGFTKPIEIFEHGAVVEYLTCPWSDGPPELCVAISHFLSEGVCERVDPGYEVIYTHHLTQGDHTCRGVVRRRADPHKDLADLGRHVSTFELPIMSLEEREALSRETSSYVLTFFVDAFVRSASPQKALASLEPKFRDEGQRAGERIVGLADRLGDADWLGSDSLLATLQCFAMRTERRGGAGIPVFSVSDCIFGAESEESCKLIRSFMAGIFECVSQGSRLRVETERDAQGRKCTVKLEAKPGRRGDHYSIGILKARFARGDISEQEYDRMLQKLRE
ncbi:MAG TPA: SHOCT domain-containing protein [Methanomassiliicoccales archaeon]|nr:SHOCT domain-containing protein [Methanomassiliicoccales archaeon]